MVVDPDRLDDFVPIKRGYNKQAYLSGLITALICCMIFFAITAGWPLEDGISWWGRILYALGGGAVVWTLYYLGGGMLKSLLAIPGYFIFVYFVCMLGMGHDLSYIFGILTMLLYVPIGGVLGWVLAQAP